MSLPTWRRIKKAVGAGPPVRALTSDPASRRAARRAADAAREIGEWSEAARLYAQALEGDEGNFAMQVQRGHALKESGSFLDAEAAYRRALALAPHDPEIHLHLGHLLRVQQRADEAMEAYAQALRLDPDYASARDELVAMGGRGRMPHQAFGRNAATDRLSSLSGALGRVEAAAADLAIVSTFPVEAWDAFRRSHETPAPPPMGAVAHLTVWIEARGLPPSAIRLTLNSLLDQTSSEWSAVVIGDPAVADHPVASVAVQDPRVVFVSSPPAERQAPTLLVDGGALLDNRAVDWFSRCLGLTDAKVIYADHDHHSRHWRKGVIYFDPALFGAPDADDIASTPEVPAAVLLASDAETVIDEVSVLDAEHRRGILRGAAVKGQAAHLPLVLSSLWRDGPAVDLSNGIALPPAPSAASAASADGRILVIIPTRDEGVMLKACIDSLLAQAAAPENLDILVLDNRSREPETRVVLNALASKGRISWRSVDEPFNWARFNNLAVRDAEADLLVFCNNDIEALSADWDIYLRRDLARTAIGVVGARLVYPDQTLQHAGVVMGRGEGRPIHEGLHSVLGDPGPLARWNRVRRVSAVTGAFMAVRRDTFADLGGFDEGLAVGYNDIDFCLKTRRSGLAILYDPEITLIHHESKTRGFNDGGERAAWDDGELETVHRRWGDALFEDMSINPRWVSAHSRVFDGYRNVGPRSAVEWLRRSARANPWRLERVTMGRLVDTGRG